MPVPRGIHFIHGISQTKLAAPSTKKKGRHPNRAISSPPSSVPRAGPNFEPASMRELAKPRWCSGKWVAKILE
jgi:hypothetical protein